jgi:riboflavin-specific deaminase-like protein
MHLHQLLPEPGELTSQEATSGLDLASKAPPERPYLVLNMVVTLDGRVAIDGRSGPVGSDADRELFLDLRTQADAVMAGAGTVRTERYGRLVRAPERRDRRTGEGLDADPLAVIVSGRLFLDAEIPLLQDPDSHVVIITDDRDGEIDGVRARVDYLRRDPHGGLRAPLEQLRREYGVRSVLCEGGPRLNAHLLREDLVDELFVSIAPKIAGQPGPTMIGAGGPETPAALELVSLLEAEAMLFTRYRVAR